MLGTTADAAAALRTTHADELVVTIRDAPPERIEALGRACDAAGAALDVTRERPLPAPSQTRAVAE